MSFKQWLTEELKSEPQKAAEAARDAARRDASLDTAREQLLLGWAREAYGVLRQAQDALTSAGQHVSLSLSVTEPALHWTDGRELLLVRVDRFTLEVRREGGQTLAVVKSEPLPGDVPWLVDNKRQTVPDAESFLKHLILSAAKK